MVIYRLEHPTSKEGIWYNEDGTYSGFCERLQDKFLSTLPMGYDPDMLRDGLNWISGADSLEQMKYWVSPNAVNEMVTAGYKMWEIKASNGRHVPNHVVFERHSEISRRDVTHLLISLHN